MTKSLGEHTGIVTAGLVTVVSTLAVYLLWKKQASRNKYPPGPFSYPILGNLPGVALHGSICDFLKECRKKYGNVFTIELGGQRRVAICGYDTIHSLLVKNADYTSNRAVNSMSPSVKEIVKETPGLFWAPYPHWKTLRSFALNVMRDEGMGKQILEAQIHDEIEKYCGRFVDPVLGQPNDLSNLKMATCNITSELVFGGRCDYDDPALKQMMELLDREVAASMRVSIMQNIPILRSTRLSGVQEMKECDLLIIKDMSERLEQSRASLDEQNPTNIFHHFLLNQRATQERTEAFKDGNAPIVAAQLYIAGTETTSTALNWAVLYTCLHPDVMRRVQEEIDSQIGRDRPVTYKDRNTLPYTEAVLLETLRLANIAPLSLPHKLDKEMVVDGQLVPAGADLLIDMASVLHDPDMFENPMEFNPDRYLTGDVAMKKQRTIPFSLGRRVCLGQSLAQMELLLFYVTFLQRYDISFPNDTPLPSMVPNESIINGPKPYKIVFSKRAD